MFDTTKVIHEFDTAHGHYQVVDMMYDGRPARVLFSGERQAAQSGIATDHKTELLFDYNQRMFELMTALEPRRLLLIGGGMYTLPAALIDSHGGIMIDVVEIDAGLDQVATDYFGLPSDDRLRIMHSDGVQFLASNQQRYDAIIIDAYSHDLADPSLSSPEAIGHLLRGLTPRGIVISNVIASYLGRRSQALHRLEHNYQQNFARVTLYPASHGQSPWLPQNLLLVARHAASPEVDQHMRYQRLDKTTEPFDLNRDLGL